MTSSEWIQIFTIITNSALVLAALKLVRHITRVEFKVDLMWEAFSRKFGIINTTPDGE